MENQTAISTQLERVPEDSAFSFHSFEHAQRVAKMLCGASITPEPFRGNIANTMIALEMSNRIGASPFLVMQNLYIVHGKPSWSSAFIIAALNACKRFSPLRFELTGTGQNATCYAWAYELNNTKEKIIGPLVTYAMATAEGWVGRKDSKWRTMPEVMLRYRAAAFFGRLYAPDILMGMHAQEEVQDIPTQVVQETAAAGTDPVVMMNSDDEPVAFEDLQGLYDEKLGLLTKKEMDHAKRILTNKETASYRKLYKFLNEKNQAA